ncbi:MAG: hypothetical protein ACQEU4_00090 [Bacillota bacterium]
MKMFGVVCRGGLWCGELGVGTLGDDSISGWDKRGENWLEWMKGFENKCGEFENKIGKLIINVVKSIIYLPNSIIKPKSR